MELLKVSDFFINHSTSCTYDDIKIKHNMFPEIVLEVYGRENPSGYITKSKEDLFNEIISSRYFFRYWLTKSILKSAYSRKKFEVIKKTPYENLIEDYFLEVNNDVEKKDLFQMFKSVDKKIFNIEYEYGETSTFECIIIDK